MTCESCESCNKTTSFLDSEVIEAYQQAFELHYTLSRALPIDHSGFDFVPGPLTLDFWHNLTVGTSLRKFVLAPNEPVYLERVVNAAKRLKISTMTNSDVAKFSNELRGLKNGTNGREGQSYFQDRSLSALQILERVLNTHVLHMDFRRNNFQQIMADNTLNRDLWHATHQFEPFMFRIHEVCSDWLGAESVISEADQWLYRGFKFVGFE